MTPRQSREQIHPVRLAAGSLAVTPPGSDRLHLIKQLLTDNRLMLAWVQIVTV